MQTQTCDGIEAALCSVQDQMKEHHRQLRLLEIQRSALEIVQKQLKELVCSECDGRGKYRKMISQDDSEIVTCEHCYGSGENPKLT